MATLERDGLTFHFVDEGAGLPFFFQHGLGGDVSQPRGLFHPPPGIRFLSLDCRGHGQTRPPGDPAKLCFESFSADLLGLMDHLHIERAVLGGISMGAAVALHAALHYPDRVLGLVLSRPAWLEGPMERNAQTYALIARLIREHGTTAGKELFVATPTYAQVLAESPDAAASLVGQFEAPGARENVARLERIPRDAPCLQLAELDAIAVPTLILANRQDPIHPFAYGDALARRIPGAELREVTPKSVSRERHAIDVGRCLAEFLPHRILNTTATLRRNAC